MVLGGFPCLYDVRCSQLSENAAQKCQGALYMLGRCNPMQKKLSQMLSNFFDVGWDLFLSFLLISPTPVLGTPPPEGGVLSGGGSVGLRTDSGPPLAGFVTAGRNVNPLHQTFQREKNDPWLLETVESAG